MAYANKWNSTDQVPLRAIERGEIGRFGSEDPSDGGNTNRFSLSMRFAGAAGSGKANAYAIKSELDLYNNFTYFLGNPVRGDQFHQHDDRTVVGGGASRTPNGSFAGLPAEATFGVQTRYDNIELGLTDTYERAFLSNVRSDKVGEGSVGIYGEGTAHWTPWLRTILGWRGDYYAASVNSIYDSADSGNVHTAIGSPKFRMVLGPFDETEFFLGAGYGMHSNDARGATITETPVDGVADPLAASSPLGRSPLLVRTKGRRGRRPNQGRAGARLLGQPVRARPGLGACVQQRRRRMPFCCTAARRSLPERRDGSDIASDRPDGVSYPHDRTATLKKSRPTAKSQLPRAPARLCSQ